MNTPGINWKEAKYKGSVLNDINYYEVSDKGMIRYRKKSAIANNVSEWKFKSIEEKRYSVVTISKKKYYVHILVAEAFVPNKNPEDAKEVDHINANTHCNCVENLQWVSQCENNLYHEERKIKFERGEILDNPCSCKHINHPNGFEVK